MLKMTVSPLDSRNSSIPNKTPLSVEMTINSSTTHSLNGQVNHRKKALGAHGNRRARKPRCDDIAPGIVKVDRSGPLHVAGGRHRGLRGIDPGYQMPAPAGAFLVERLLGLVGDAAQRGDVDRLEELVILLAHHAFAAVEHVELHALQSGCDLTGSIELAFSAAALNIRISLTARGYHSDMFSLARKSFSKSIAVLLPEFGMPSEIWNTWWSSPVCLTAVGPPAPPA